MWPGPQPAKGTGAKVPYSILIVDDNASIRRSLRSCIQQNTHWIVCGEADNGKIAIERVKELNPDLVILDLQMPIMNGLEAARQISRLAPNTAMLMFTMYNCEPSFERGSGRWHQRRSLKI